MYLIKSEKVHHNEDYETVKLIKLYKHKVTWNKNFNRLRNTNIK